MKVLSSAEFKVGLLVLIASGLIAFMSIRISENPSPFGHAQKVWLELSDASGLVQKSAVKMAGIKVGIIRNIRLKDGKAILELELRSDLPVTTSMQAEVRADGILGDKHVELIPGDPNDPPMQNGAQIVNVIDKGTFDQVMNQVGSITKSLKKVSQALEEAAVDGKAETPLGRIVHNIESISNDLSELIGTRKEKIGGIIDNIHNVTDEINALVNDNGERSLRVAWNNAVDSLGSLDRSLDNIEEITEKLNKGEGTLGRLINDESTVVELNTAIAGVNNMLDAGSKLETSIDFHSEVLTNPGLTKSYLGVRIQPGLDRYYEIAVIDDPKGVIETTETKTRVNQGTETTTDEVKTFKHRVKFSALFAKNFYNLTLRGGVMENAGGVGIDYYFFRRNLRLSVEAFDFGDTHLKTYLRYNFFKGIYVIGGGDDLLDKDGNASTFIGAGLFLTNDDIKLLLSRLSL